MKFNQSVHYGIACLLELAKMPLDYIEASRIAACRNIPLAYTHKVLQHLGHAGLVYAHKGMGYKLARPLSDITVIDVMEAVRKNGEPVSAPSPVGLNVEKRVNAVLQ